MTYSDLHVLEELGLLSLICLHNDCGSVRAVLGDSGGSGGGSLGRLVGHGDHGDGEPAGGQDDGGGPGSDLGPGRLVGHGDLRDRHPAGRQDDGGICKTCRGGLRRNQAC